MSIGERANLSVPYHLAWGDKGFPGKKKIQDMNVVIWNGLVKSAH